MGMIFICGACEKELSIKKSYQLGTTIKLVLEECDCVVQDENSLEIVEDQLKTLKETHQNLVDEMEAIVDRFKNNQPLDEENM